MGIVERRPPPSRPVEIVRPVKKPVEPVVLFAPVVTQPEPGRLKMADIQRVVAQHYGIPVAHLLCKSRAARLIKPRHVSMFLARRWTSVSFPEIGRRTGGRHHTTALHGFKKIAAAITTDEKLAADVAEIQALLGVDDASLIEGPE